MPAEFANDDLVDDTDTGVVLGGDRGPVIPAGEGDFVDLDVGDSDDKDDSLLPFWNVERPFSVNDGSHVDPDTVNSGVSTKSIILGDAARRKIEYFEKNPTFMDDVFSTVGVGIKALRDRFGRV